MIREKWKNIFLKPANPKRTVGENISASHETGDHKETAAPKAERLPDPDYASNVCLGLDTEETLNRLDSIKDALENIWISATIGENARPDTLMFCGAVKGEGASFLAAHFALFLAMEYERRVLLVDTAMDGGAGGFPGCEFNEGLSTFLEKGVPLRSLVRGTEFKNLYFLPGGKGRKPAGAMSFVRHEDCLSALAAFCREQFDVAIFDGQPVITNPAMIEFAQAVEMVLMVCRYGVSRREVTRLAVNKLTAAGITVRGTVLNAREYPVPPGIYKLLG